VNVIGWGGEKKRKGEEKEKEFILDALQRNVADKGEREGKKVSFFRIAIPDNQAGRRGKEGRRGKRGESCTFL